MYQIRTRCSILQVLLGNMLAVTSYLCAAPTIDDVESRVIASRMAIKSARLEISDRDVESPDYFQTRNWSVYWDERNQRVDTRAKALSGPGVQQTPTAYQCSTIVCFAGEDYYSYTSSNPNCVLTVNKKAEAAGKTAMIINPRHLGTNPLGICFGNSFHLRSFVGAKQRSEEAIVASKWKGLNAWNIRYKMTDGSLLSYVAVPELGYSIVEIEQRYELEGRKEQH